MLPHGTKSSPWPLSIAKDLKHSPQKKLLNFINNYQNVDVWSYKELHPHPIVTISNDPNYYILIIVEIDKIQHVGFIH